MPDVSVGKGNLAGKGVFASRNFKSGEVVIKYNLKPISQTAYKALFEDEKEFTHTHWGQIF